MRKIVSVGLLSFLILSGIALAYQSGEQEKSSSSMQNMMDDMMKGEKDGEEGKEGMGGMMRMMKMMDQCSSMMESSKEPGGAKESQK